MAISLVSPSTALAVSLDTIKQHCREIDAAHDDTITGYIRAATEWLQLRTSRQFVYQAMRLTMDSFGDCRYVRHGRIEIPRAPVRANAPTVSYVADGGSTYTTLSSTAYVFDTSGEPARVAIKDGQSWPITERMPGAVRVDFVAGYGTSTDHDANIPERAKVAIGQMAAHWHANRESIGGDLRVVPQSAQMLATTLVWEPVR